MFQFNRYKPGLWILGASLLSFSYGTDPKYVEEIKIWHKARIESLKKEDGWLNLAGLYWLKPGSNTFGDAADNQIVFPKGKSAARLGRLILENGEVWVETTPGEEIWQGDQPIEKLKIFSAGNPDPLLLRHRSLRWYVIKRGDKYGIRLRDLEHPALTSFKGIDAYPIDAKWKVEAKLETFPEERKIPITDVLGQTSMQVSPGTLVFTLKGKEHRLDAVESGDELFILFADKTNQKHTYQSGRFLYAKKPAAGGKTTLDFNKAYNPPCAFTEFATCPLPPPQNTLSIAVSAGEKRYGEH
ncbi:DUF1684 domain-containing protein [Haliscomenobacter hydrossis]|uniref:DUF1684 domain-containing protein n=1 Tax=Haliscomenobacter hydrossis (strain ATCC 27775 / DSM 1100 / LMG 10767 / O) TaxID=760192 RepID=F4L4J9_HALH1|nr:DUF1684 domain-containing protein [Haliscomenobacter hydrossis]AEE52000.1 protein of unknown function DUF1684 [Haliscomenobacter hydrossis DSM 1100]